jgi:hypothetical protein
LSAISLAAVPAITVPTDNRAVRRRVGVIWGLLFFNVLVFTASPMIVPIPLKIGKALTQGSLAVALLLALTVNRKLVVRPNVFLNILSVLAAAALAMSIRGYFGLGSDIRAARLIGFLCVLWLLTPWWGRRDLLIVRCQLRCLVTILALVVIGFLISPHKAFTDQGGRLSGAIWPMPATQVAHFAAVTAGMTAVLWFAGLMRRNLALALFVGSLGILVLTHTRTALVAMLVGILVAGISLFTGHRRVRKVFMTVLIIAAIGAVVLLPALSTWFTRGENTQEFTNLTGRTVVWTALLNAPRAEPNILFGYGLSNDSFDGLSIDSSWIATYQDEGIFGDVLCGLALLSLIVLAALRPRGPARALALFLLVYCAISSFTEVGLGNASTFMLDLAVAASLLAPFPLPTLLAET